MTYGLSESDLKEMQQAFESIPEIEEVILFGSRAMGNYKPGSDIDLAVAGPQFSSKQLRLLEFKLNQETLIPYFIDIVSLTELQNPLLREHITTYGCSLYSKLRKTS